MIIGMTGTRDGMTNAQKDSFLRGLEHFRAATLHHGDCVGADAEAHEIAAGRGMAITIHPPKDSRYRAYKREEGDQEMDPLGYFQRNRNIVKASDILFGVPKTKVDIGGGTWYTIKYGKGSGKPVYIIYPDGFVESHNITT
jgi:hypothetical protein